MSGRVGVASSLAANSEWNARVAVMGQRNLSLSETAMTCGCGPVQTIKEFNSRSVRMLFVRIRRELREGLDHARVKLFSGTLTEKSHCFLMQHGWRRLWL